jgi:hypothetical protein
MAYGLLLCFKFWGFVKFFSAQYSFSADISAIGRTSVLSLTRTETGKNRAPHDKTEEILTFFHRILINYLNLQKSSGICNEETRNSMKCRKSSMNGRSLFSAGFRRFYAAEIRLEK